MVERMVDPMAALSVVLWVVMTASHCVVGLACVTVVDLASEMAGWLVGLLVVRLVARLAS